MVPSVSFQSPPSKLNRAKYFRNRICISKLVEHIGLGQDSRTPGRNSLRNFT
jgi:hypothetical protein